MTVYELNRDQLDELKASYAEQLHNDGISWGELARACEIPDEIIYQHYEGVYFVNDDFSCSAETSETPPKLCVCSRCLMGIESHEGQQITRKIYLDDDDPRPCDWCENDGLDILYEIQ